MLERVVSKQTRSLVLVDERTPVESRSDTCAMDFRRKMGTIRGVLESKGIRLPLLIVKNGYESPRPWYSSFFWLRLNEDSEQFECSYLPRWMSVCEKLVLLNYTTCDDTGTNSKLLVLFYECGLTWPDGENAFMRDDDEGQLDIVIPFVRFRGTETAAEHCRRFIAAVSSSCPAVTEEIKEKITAVHARWLQTLAYPEQWAGIRGFFQMYNGFRHDGSRQRWDQVDLRQLDMSLLNHLTFAALDFYYKD
ncbi:uncharacterized protein LOC129596903 [Paramacrobiotus metropolitanus]|uniref:uncharacterized protein LOC129596903 n=1 Tax=Paramacrobiotus metropolitanus TaxID=2943436 RepID=UPI002446220F|nr:uncharacterized protein LOC129596903 [Paramacrobiotus metropolitanus]